MLPLETFRKIMGYHPYHFWQLANGNVPVTSSCNTLVYKYPWQTADAAGRDEIFEAIKQAERKMSEYLGFDVMPTYRTETIKWPPYPDKHVWRYGWTGSEGKWESIQLNKGYIQDIGVETFTQIGKVEIKLSDENSDGICDTFTATIATTVTDPDEIWVFFVEDDGRGETEYTDQWRIQPVTTSISSGTATIKGPSWLVVKPELYEGISVSGIDPEDESNTYVSDVDIIRHYIYTEGTVVGTSQADLVWETIPYPEWVSYCCGTNTAYTDPATIAAAVARVGIRDSEKGIVTPAQSVYSSTTGLWYAVKWLDNSVCRPPDRVDIRYYAGYPLESQQMAAKWQRPVAYMAAAELSKPICACDQANRNLYRWQFETSRSSGANDESYNIPEDDRNNPFGTRNGHIEAWRAVRAARRFEGIANL